MSDSSEFSAKWLKKLPDGFADNANSMSEEELKKVIVDCEGSIYTVEREKDNDAKLNGARDLVKDLSGPYRDTKACYTAKIKYALWVLEGRGVSLDKA